MGIETAELVEQGSVPVTIYLQGAYGTLRSATPQSFQKKRNASRYVFIVRAGQFAEGSAGKRRLPGKPLVFYLLPPTMQT